MDFETVGLALLYVFVGICLGIVGMGASLFRATESIVREKNAALAEAADSKGKMLGFKTVLSEAEESFTDERDRFRSASFTQTARIDSLLAQLQVMAERMATARLNGKDDGSRDTEPPAFVNVDADATTPAYSDELQKFMDRVENMEVEQHLESYIATRRRDGIPDGEILTEIEDGEI